jgi:hypothetical protein
VNIVMQICRLRALYIYLMPVYEIKHDKFHNRDDRELESRFLDLRTCPRCTVSARSHTG